MEVGPTTSRSPQRCVTSTLAKHVLPKNEWGKRVASTLPRRHLEARNSSGRTQLAEMQSVLAQRSVTRPFVAQRNARKVSQRCMRYDESPNVTFALALIGSMVIQDSSPC
jgi:hypothetical protein